jgi:hypothetical protein
MFGQWAILELMGHVRLAGFVTEEAHFGTALGRIDVPGADGPTTQYFGGASVYRLTPTTEEIARSVATHNTPEPVYRWELPAPTKEAPTASRRYTCEYDECLNDAAYEITIKPDGEDTYPVFACTEHLDALRPETDNYDIDYVHEVAK